MEDQGWITGKHGPVELRTDFKSSLLLDTECPEADFCRELRLVGHDSGDGPGQVKRLGARSLAGQRAQTEVTWVEGEDLLGGLKLGKRDSAAGWSGRQELSPRRGLG